MSGRICHGRKRQWIIAPKDGRPLAIAVIWEAWARTDDRGREEMLLTFAMATTPANALIAKVTDRMPAILQPEDWPTWLGETGAPIGDVKALLKTYEDEGTWEMTPQAPRRSGQGGDRQGELF
jgi:putative SOS response-associated peptidase YedK